MHEWADHRADCVVDQVSFLIGKAWEAVVIRESQMGQKRRVQHHRLYSILFHTSSWSAAFSFRFYSTTFRIGDVGLDQVWSTRPAA